MDGEGRSIHLQVIEKLRRETGPGMGTGPGFPARRFRNPGFFDPARNGSGLTRRFLTRDPDFFENKTRTRPGPGFFQKFNPDPARAGIGQPGPEFWIGKKFQINNINYYTVFPFVDTPCIYKDPRPDYIKILYIVWIYYFYVLDTTS